MDENMAYIVNSGGDNTTGQVCFMREQMCMHAWFICGSQGYCGFPLIAAVWRFHRPASP